MSPTPGRSTLITSAPNHARSCVQVGPDCTWVKSRMRTPSSARPAWPQGFADGRGKPLAATGPLRAGRAAGFFPALSLTTFFADFLAAEALDEALDFALAAFLRAAISRSLISCKPRSAD